MKRLITAIGVVLIASGLGTPRSMGQGPGDKHGAANQNPLSTHPQHKIPQLTHPQPKTHQPSQSYKHPPKHGYKHPQKRHRHHYPSRAYGRPYGYGYGYGYYPYVNPYYPYPYQYPYSYAPWSWRYSYYPPPLYIPAEELYGPEAVKRFMGAGQMNVPAQDPGVVMPRVDRDLGARADVDKKGNQRATNPEALALAWKFIGFGDAHFANQKYPDAYQRYKKAAQAAPGLADAYFRQGYALAAQERYDLAARALKHGLTLDPGWPRSNFRGDELYGHNRLAKKAHMDALAKAVKAEPHDADAVFLQAVFYYFDDQRGRAKPLLHKAAQMLGDQGDCLAGFIAEVK